MQSTPHREYPIVEFLLLLLFTLGGFKSKIQLLSQGKSSLLLYAVSYEVSKGWFQYLKQFNLLNETHFELEQYVISSSVSILSMPLVSMVIALFKHLELYIIELFHAMVTREIKLSVKLILLYDTSFLREIQMGCFSNLKHMYVSGPFNTKPQELWE